ncbi:MAG: M24 family metallopeptidase [Alkalilacustris sp.]
MPFLSRAVFDYRLASMQKLMEEDGLDALLFGQPDFAFFASNFAVDVEPWERPTAVVIPRNGTPFMVVNELSTNHIRMARERGTLWIDDVTIYAEHSRAPLPHSTPDWPRLMAERLGDHGLATGRIGTDGIFEALAGVRSHLPDLTLTAMHRRLRDLRLVKHPEELDLLRTVAAFSHEGMEELKRQIAPGRVVQEVDRLVEARMHALAAERFAGQNMEIRVGTLAGPAAASPHGTGAPTGMRYEEGCVLISNVIFRLNGMVVENERTLFCGRPTDDRHFRAYDAALSANRAAFQQFVAGNPVAAVDRAATQAIEQAGFADCIFHRTGHGVGMKGHEYPDDMAFLERPLMENEVYSCEPGIYIWGLGGYRIDDTVIVGRTEPESVVTTPRDIDWAIAAN